MFKMSTLSTHTSSELCTLRVNQCIVERERLRHFSLRLSYRIPYAIYCKAGPWTFRLIS